jgi:uncharacterized membrane protein YvlD (DUF360 family)
VAFVIGVLYGAVKAGRQDKSGLLLQGLLIGVILAVVLALVGFFTGHGALGVAGGLAIVWGALVLTLVFVLGVWVGDLLTGQRKTRRYA